MSMLMKLTPGLQNLNTIIADQLPVGVNPGESNSGKEHDLQGEDDDVDGDVEETDDDGALPQGEKVAAPVVWKHRLMIHLADSILGSVFKMTKINTS